MASYKTRGRAAITGYFAAHADEHLTAAEVVSALGARGTPAALSTVYRTLLRLESEGELRRYETGENGAACWQYAGGAECAGHFHLKCTQCGVLIHAACDYLAQMGGHVESHHGFMIDNRRTVFYGRCSGCAGREGR